MYYGIDRIKKVAEALGSNENISPMIVLGMRKEIPSAAILGSEIAGDSKPKNRLYRSAREPVSLSKALGA